jgi:hypothetical protein
MGRWLFVYVPITIGIVGALYIVAEIMLKRVANTSIKAEIQKLPEVPVVGPPPSRHSTPASGRSPAPASMPTVLVDFRSPHQTETKEPAQLKPLETRGYSTDGSSWSFLAPHALS